MVSQRTPLVPFFLLSVGLHLLLFFPWPNSPEREKTGEQIPVAFLPSPENRKAPADKPKEITTRTSRAAAQLARKTSLPQEAKERDPRPPERELSRDAPDLAPNEQREQPTIVRRPLPTLKELLPPVTWSSAGERNRGKEEAVRLDTREPKYVSYFTSIKRAIELVWEYPEPALRHGLQGKLLLEFTILGNGSMEGPRLIRSSGFSALDQEAIRAVKAASPFLPIPPWIGKNRLDIIASFEYHDNRLKYGFVP